MLRQTAYDNSRREKKKAEHPRAKRQCSREGKKTRGGLGSDGDHGEGRGEAQDQDPDDPPQPPSTPPLILQHQLHERPASGTYEGWSLGPTPGSTGELLSPRFLLMGLVCLAALLINSTDTHHAVPNRR